jgi:hypothetical protein
MTSRRVSREAALASSIGGTLVTCVWIFGALTNASWASIVHPGIVGLGTAGLLMLVVTMFTPPVENHAVNKYFAEVT